MNQLVEVQKQALEEAAKMDEENKKSIQRLKGEQLRLSEKYDSAQGKII